MEVKPTTKMVYFRYHFLFLVISICFLLFLISMFSVCITTNIISHKYKSIEEAKVMVQQNQISSLNYIKINKNKILYSNINNHFTRIGLDWYHHGKKTNSLPTYTYAIKNNAEYIIFLSDKYVFLNNYLYNNFKSPLSVFTSLYFIVELIIYLIIVKKLHNLTEQNMNYIQSIVKSFNAGNLTVKIERSKIYEYDNVLKAFDVLRDNFLKSEKDRWKKNKLIQKQVSSIAHDLKGPLAIIKGNTELLSDIGNNESSNRYSSILRQVDTIESFINEFIDFSKIQTIDNLHLTEYRISQIIVYLEEVINDMQMAYSRKIILIIHHERNIVCKLNLIYFQRMIYNLLKNALEYSEDIITVNISETSQILSISILDFGKGMSVQEIEHCTELFYTANQNINRNKHFGIGLSLVIDVLEKHNGKLSIDSKKGKYTKMIISLPAYYEKKRC